MARFSIMGTSNFVPLITFFQTFIFTLNGSPIYPDPESENLNQADPFSHGGRVAELKEEKKGKPPVLEGYTEGPHPLISDSLYSLIIFIYVAVTFLYMFYGFCWRQPEREKPESKDDEDA
eukprot:TRINITY_DN30884_c0_g1_i1.p1 TRINITY_DN30884_c0_g1~~TRINITY_DN30884_c0_g1_i1.p1  ORF type:complete len:120 (+),score=32.65 TRINITY_DN30884_c0_g1_i1:163-522(+)